MCRGWSYIPASVSTWVHVTCLCWVVLVIVVTFVCVTKSPILAMELYKQVSSCIAGYVSRYENAHVEGGMLIAVKVSLNRCLSLCNYEPLCIAGKELHGQNELFDEYTNRIPNPNTRLSTPRIRYCIPSTQSKQ